MAHILRCLFVRHGQTDHNLQKRFQGHLPIPLNETGYLQARRAGHLVQNLLKQEGQSKTKATLFTSDLLRTIQTSLKIAQALSNFEVSTLQDPRLREFHSGLCTDKTFAEVSEEHPKIIKKYLTQFEKDPSNTPYPGEGGESPRDVLKRFHDFFNDNICLHESPWIVCSHGGALQTFLSYTTKMSRKNKLPTHIGNGDVIEVQVDSGNWTIHRCYNNNQ